MRGGEKEAKEKEKEKKKHTHTHKGKSQSKSRSTVQTHNTNRAQVIHVMLAMLCLTRHHRKGIEIDLARALAWMATNQPKGKKTKKKCVRQCD